MGKIIVIDYGLPGGCRDVGMILSDIDGRLIIHGNFEDYAAVNKKFEDWAAQGDNTLHVIYTALIRKGRVESYAGSVDKVIELKKFWWGMNSYCWEEE